MDGEKTKNIFKAIPLSIFGLIEVYAIYGIVVLIIAFIFGFISQIPLFNLITDWMFRIRGDIPDLFAMVAGAMFAYFGTSSTFQRIAKKSGATALMLTGIYLVTLNVIFLISNLAIGNAIIVNIVLTITGIIMIRKGLYVSALEEGK